MRENNISVKVVSWTIPLFGNSHSCPYGMIEVQGTLSNGKEVKRQILQTKGGTWHEYTQYVIINRQRYILRNEGTMHNPKLYLEKWPKVKINGRWYYEK